MSRSHLPRQSSIDLDSPDRPFDNIINFRDVGRSINRSMGKEVLKEGVFFRSARLDDASERDIRRLTDELRMATVIDLRSSTEHQMATDKRRQETASETTIPVTNTSTTTTEPREHLPDLPGVKRSLISLTGRAFERSLLWRLDWWSLLKVLAYVASGYRSDAVMIIGEHVMRPRGLVGLGKDTLDSSTGEMREIFEILAGACNSSPRLSVVVRGKGSDDVEEGDDDGGGEEVGGVREERNRYPVLVHCTQGKDRTGLVVLLALLLTGVVDDDALVGDYVRSEGELVVEFEERIKEIRMLGLDEEYTKCPPGFTGEIRRYLEEKYGGVEGYLGLVGVDEEMMERVRRSLMA